jgi:predicted ArsR family transcriptional regulator
MTERFREVEGDGIWGQPRGRLLRELCGRPQTAAELAERVATSANAVRVHLAALRQMGLVDYRIERRGVGKPTHVFSLTTSAEYLLSNAYAPTLGVMLGTLHERLDEELVPLLRAAGVKLSGRLRADGSTHPGLDSAADCLRALGAVVSVEPRGAGLVMRSPCCPLGVVTRHSPELCTLVEAMVGAASGLPVRQECERGDHPRCAFVMGVAAGAGARPPRRSTT